MSSDPHTELEYQKADPSLKQHIMPVTRGTLFIYAVVLLGLGLASAFIDPNNMKFGWYDTGKSGLIACGIGAVLSIILRAVIGAGGKAARIGSLCAALVTFLFIAQAGSTLFKDGRKWSGGEDHLWFKVLLMGCVFVISLFAFVRIVGEVRSRSGNS